VCLKTLTCKSHGASHKWFSDYTGGCANW